jgi:hypothetical protein
MPNAAPYALGIGRMVGRTDTPASPTVHRFFAPPNPVGDCTRSWIKKIETLRQKGLKRRQSVGDPRYEKNGRDGYAEGRQARWTKDGSAW